MSRYDLVSSGPIRSLTDLSIFQLPIQDMANKLGAMRKNVCARP